MKRNWAAGALAIAILIAGAGCGTGNSSAGSGSGFSDSQAGQQSSAEWDPGEAPENGLALSADYLVLGIGRSKKLVLYDGGEEISSSVVWTVSGDSASVSGGLVTGISEGECVVTATYGERTVSAKVVVCFLRNLSVAQAEIVLYPGGTAKVEAELTELADGEPVTADGEASYISENPEIVTVASDGLLTGVKSGVARVIVQCGELGCTVTVNVCEPISTAEEFVEKLGSAPDGTFLITQDLDFSGMQYFAIPEFSGTLFGGGHRLTGIVPVNHPANNTEWGGALFGELTGSVRDLAIEASYIPVIRETDGAEQLGIQQFGGTVANYLYGTLENVFVRVYFELYPWWSANWNEAGAICGRLCGGAMIRNCIVEYSTATQSSPLGSGKADIHALYGQGQDCAGALIENVYILNSGDYRKEYRNAGSGYFGATEPRFKGVYEYEDLSSLKEAVKGTALEAVFGYAYPEKNEDEISEGKE